jgi:uncharacterized protein (TIGR02679 family)
MSVDLEALAADPDLHPVWREVHRRLCSGASPRELATVYVPHLSFAAVGTLRTWLDRTGRRRNGASAVRQDSTGRWRIPLRELWARLDLDDQGVIAMVESATGAPVVDGATLRRQAHQARADTWEYATARLARVPGLVARMRAAGVGEDQDGVLDHIDALAAVVDELPLDPPVSLPKLAHDTVGDPHYFDLDRLAGQRLVAAVEEVLGRDPVTLPHHARALLAAAGIIADRLSATVLLYQVRASGPSSLDARLREARVPVALTLLDLTADAPQLPAGELLTVVENPSVLEAVMAVGAPGAWACTSGDLRAVDHALLHLAVTCGARLRYAGDLDGKGVQIAAQVRSLYGAEIIAMSPETITASAQGYPRVRLRSSQGEVVTGRSRMGEPPVVYQEHDAVIEALLRPC